MHPLVKCVIPAAVCCSLLSDSEAAPREERPNHVGGELLGRGLILSFNYERFFAPHLGAGVGLMAISTEGATVTIVPLYLQYLSGDRHNLYLGAGATVFAGGDSIQDYESRTALTFSIGYEFQASSGFYIRPLFTYLNLTDEGTDDTGLLWPGISVGGAF